jgi:hypothetical protein
MPAPPRGRRRELSGSAHGQRNNWRCKLTIQDTGLKLSRFQYLSSTGVTRDLTNLAAPHECPSGFRIMAIDGTHDGSPSRGRQTGRQATPSSELRSRRQVRIWATRQRDMGAWGQMRNQWAHGIKTLGNHRRVASRRRVRSSGVNDGHGDASECIASDSEGTMVEGVQYRGE